MRKVSVFSRSREANDIGDFTLRNIFYSLVIVGTLAVINGCAATSGAEAEEGLEMQTIFMEMSVPSSGWKLRIDEVYEVDEEIWVIASLEKPGNASAQVITDVFATVGVFSAPRPIKYYVIGKTWKWGNDADDFTYIDKRSEVIDDLVFGKLLYSRNKDVANE